LVLFREYRHNVNMTTPRRRPGLSLGEDEAIFFVGLQVYMGVK